MYGIRRDMDDNDGVSNTLSSRIGEFGLCDKATMKKGEHRKKGYVSSPWVYSGADLSSTEW